jgi:hypothetical protein
MVRQSNRPVVSYISEFRRYAYDLTWNDPALMEQFRCGLSDEIKDMQLNFPKPTMLDEIIKFAVDCDNRLFERYQERRQQWSAKIPTHTPRQVSTLAIVVNEGRQVEQALASNSMVEPLRRGLVLREDQI